MSVLEQALVDLGRHLRYPEAPDLAPGVVRQLRAPGPSPARRRMAILAAATLALLVGGLAALSPTVRAALFRVLNLPGVRIEVGAPGPEAPVRTLGDGLALGSRTSLARAQAQAEFPIQVPSSLGPPDRVYLERDRAGGTVWLVYGPRMGLPEAEETGVGLLVTEFRGSVDEEFLKKVTYEGGSVMPVEVDGSRGFWLRGAHTLIFLDERGFPIEDRTRVAGNVLVWEADGVTYRLESDLGLVDTLEIARSMT